MPEPEVRMAGPGDAERVGRLLHDFNVEYEDYTPGPEALAERVRELVESDEITVLVAGSEPHGLVVLRFQTSLWKRALDAYVEELYVVPDRRGQGAGRALMTAAINLARECGAWYIHLGTSEDDRAARGLYESLGFTNLERQPDGPVMYYYEREL